MTFLFNGLGEFSEKISPEGCKIFPVLCNGNFINMGKELVSLKLLSPCTEKSCQLKSITSKVDIIAS